MAALIFSIIALFLQLEAERDKAENDMNRYLSELGVKL